MILDFKDRRTAEIWNGTPVLRLPIEIQEIARRKLRMLNNAQTLVDLRIPPSNRLERLKGDRKGQHSIRVNDQWRICSTWGPSGASKVEIVDYH